MVIFDRPPTKEEAKENWKKNRRGTFIALGLILGFLASVIILAVTIRTA